MNIFFTGTEKGCGKTMLAGGIASVMQSLEYSTGVYKPIQTGALDGGKCLISPDLSFVKMLNPYIQTHSTYMFKTKAMPIIGAELEHKNINIDEIVRDYNILNEKTDILIVESTGGLMMPVKDNIFNAHIPLSLKIPVVFIICPSADGLENCINTLNTAKSAELDVAGIIINKYQPYSENPDIKAFPTLIENYTDTKILGIIRTFKGKTVAENVLFKEILNGVNLQELFNIKIPKLSGF